MAARRAACSASSAASMAMIDRLVVARRAARRGAHSPVDALRTRGKRDRLPAGWYSALSRSIGLPGGAAPLRGIDRLPIVVRVEHDRARRAGNAQLAVHRRRCAFHLEELGLGPAPPQHRDECVGVPADVRKVAGDVRQGEKRRELAQDRGLVRGAIRARRFARRSTRELLRAEWDGDGRVDRREGGERCEHRRAHPAGIG